MAGIQGFDAVMNSRMKGGTAEPLREILNVVIDEKSPTYAPPTFVRVTPAELVAVGDE